MIKALRIVALALTVTLGGLSALAPSPALALDYNQAKMQGLVGERPDGLLGAVRNAPDVAALIRDVNQRRLAHYRDLAQKRGVSVQAVQAIFGKKLIDEAPPGSFVMGPDGQWRRK